MEYNREGTRDLAFLKTDGTRLAPDAATGNVTLVNGTTYYSPLGDQDAPAPSQTSLDSVHIKWDATFVGVFTIETTNFPRKRGGQWIGSDDVTDYGTTKGNWIQEIPSSADVSVTSTDGTTGGATHDGHLKITVEGGTAGGCMIHLGNLGSRRARVKTAVTTGGAVRMSHTGKNAA